MLNDNINDYLVNFQNLIFSPRKTVEFRLHTATVNKYKTVNWLFICNAIIKYAENNIQSIIKGDSVCFADVLNYYRDHFKNEKGRNVSEVLNNYVVERTNYFQKDLADGDHVSSNDAYRDKSFVAEGII